MVHSSQEEGSIDSKTVINQLDQLGITYYAYLLLTETGKK